MAAHVIYRGPVEREPETINLPVDAVTYPGEFVLSDSTKLSIAADGFGRLLLASNRRMYTQTDLDPYAADETGIAYRLEVEQEYRARAVAATYTVGQELTVNSAGRLVAAAAGNRVVAFADVAVVLAAVGLMDVVIANSYIKA